MRSAKLQKSERQLLLNIKSFEQIFYLFFIDIALITVKVVNVASDSFTNIKTASFFKQRSQHFYFFHIDHISHPLPVKIGNQVSLVDEYFSVLACTCSYGLHFALSHKLAYCVFGKTADKCGALLDSQHLHLICGRCFGGLRNGVLSVLGELNEQLQNVVYDLFFLCCSHCDKPLSFYGLCL